MDEWTKVLMADLRSTGEVTSGPLAGKPHLIMTSTGAKTGEPREAVLSFVRDGDSYVVAGTAGGSPTDPNWVHNVTANPEVKVEVQRRTFQARAHVVDDDATYERLWDALVASRPDFAAYPPKARRKIPVITLDPIESDQAPSSFRSISLSQARSPTVARSRDLAILWDRLRMHFEDHHPPHFHAVYGARSRSRSGGCKSRMERFHRGRWD